LGPFDGAQDWVRLGLFWVKLALFLALLASNWVRFGFVLGSFFGEIGVFW
jgi:hypothetical protein